MNEEQKSTKNKKRPAPPIKSPELRMYTGRTNYKLPPKTQSVISSYSEYTQLYKNNGEFYHLKRNGTTHNPFINNNYSPLQANYSSPDPLPFNASLPAPQSFDTPAKPLKTANIDGAIASPHMKGEYKDDIDVDMGKEDDMAYLKDVIDDK
jgi:hypothetical protein